MARCASITWPPPKLRTEPGYGAKPHVTLTAADGWWRAAVAPAKWRATPLPCANGRSRGHGARRWPARALECGPGLCPLLRLSRPVRPGAWCASPATPPPAGAARTRPKLDNGPFRDPVLSIPHRRLCPHHKPKSASLGSRVGIVCLFLCLFVCFFVCLFPLT